MIVISPCLFLLYIYKSAADWTLADMGKSYIDSKPREKVLDKMDSRNYQPLKKGQLCNDYKNYYELCNHNAKKNIRVLIVDQLPVMATQLGCGKRMYHLIEGLVGVNYEVG